VAVYRLDDDSISDAGGGVGVNRLGHASSIFCMKSAEILLIAQNMADLALRVRVGNAIILTISDWAFFAHEGDVR